MAEQEDEELKGRRWVLLFAVAAVIGMFISTGLIVVSASVLAKVMTAGPGPMGGELYRLGVLVYSAGILLSAGLTVAQGWFAFHLFRSYRTGCPLPRPLRARGE